MSKVTKLTHTQSRVILADPEVCRENLRLPATLSLEEQLAANRTEPPHLPQN